MKASATELADTIEITVNTRFLDEQSNPDAAEYAFAYHITIANRGEQSVQLLYRHWFITDGNNNVREVEGEGVVGQQPHIEPGQSFEYASGAILATKIGMMEGSYQMLAANGESFHAPIQPFSLVHPHSLQ